MSPRSHPSSEPTTPSTAGLPASALTEAPTKRRRAQRGSESEELSAEADLPLHGARRVVIEHLTPQVDDGRFAAKRTLGEEVAVEADVFTDGHDAVRCRLLHRAEKSTVWERCLMSPLGNDRWRASFRPLHLGRELYTVEAWVDHLETWRRDLLKRQSAGQDVSIDLLRGAALVDEAALRAESNSDAERLREWGRALANRTVSAEERMNLAQSEELHGIAARCPDPVQLLRYEPTLTIDIDRERARFSSWYEWFPRSVAGESGERGTLRDCVQHLPYVERMGFDVLYLPPIHPIGTSERKGPNNRPSSNPNDPGSPWAIGSAAGGHKSIAPELGTLKDFQELVKHAAELGIEIALDIAFQCSPDHPYVREHPEWFLHRPDGSIQYAENPPKKYQDIYPFNFETPAWRELWLELASVVEFWIEQGVRIFRVDNPHTKPFAFWEWLIARVKQAHPEVIFLSEAFTRPKVMYRLAKLGFTQSYTYFTWRNSRSELTEYFEQLSTVRDFFRPNLWPNTPDILSEYLQYGGRPAFVVRVVLAATLAASYGIYGPAFELLEHQAREPGSEEYRDSEKYQLREWNLERPDSLVELIGRINRVRRESKALQSDLGLSFHRSDNDTLLVYSKTTPTLSEAILVVVNLDPHHIQSGWLDLNLQALGIEADQTFQAHDLLSGSRFLWKGARNYVALDPNNSPAHILRVRRRVRSERDFDYFL
jgi:starch synthase (maltosyl-transferring)